MSQNRARLGSKKHVIMLTAGGSNSNVELTLKEAISLKQQGVHISIMAVGRTVNHHHLDTIASSPADKNCMWKSSYSDTMQLVEKACKVTCNDVDECASNPCENGGTCLDSNQMYTCVCPTSLMGINCQINCQNPRKDIALLVDISGSPKMVSEIIVTLVRKTIMMLNIDNGDVRLALVTYANNAQVVFRLDSYQNRNSMLNALAIVRSTGKTNIQEAVDLAMDAVFVANLGDRSDANDVMIIITDGRCTVEKEKLQSAIKRAKDRGIHISSIGVGKKARVDELQMMASGSKCVHQVDKVLSLDNILSGVIERICLNDCTSNTTNILS